jgi:hypothetical protein
MWYFVIYSSEDGEVSVERLSKEDLEKRLNENYWGDKPKFLSESDDLAYNAGLMIIKGELVTPQPKKVVEEWDV